MAEIGRGARLGKYIAKSINQFSSLEFQEAVKNPSYIKTIKEIMSVPFVARKKGELNPESNISELENISFEDFNIANPAHYAALLRERGHMKYNADTSNRVRKALLDNL